jgi:hypothetical protein
MALLRRTTIFRPSRCVQSVDHARVVARRCIHGNTEISQLWSRVAVESLRVWHSEEDVVWSQIAVYDGVPIAHRVALYYTSFEKQSRNGQAFEDMPKERLRDPRGFTCIFRVLLSRLVVLVQHLVTTLQWAISVSESQHASSHTDPHTSSYAIDRATGLNVAIHDWKNTRASRFRKHIAGVYVLRDCQWSATLIDKRGYSPRGIFETAFAFQRCASSGSSRCIQSLASPSDQTWSQLQSGPSFRHRLERKGLGRGPRDTGLLLSGCDHIL